MNELSWRWIVLMLTAPPVGALLVAYPVWRTSQIILGNLAGATVIFGTALALMLREYAELDRLARRCLDVGLTCWPEPSAFTRYAIYAFIAAMEVFALFASSLKVEKSLRNRDYAPEWRR